MVTALYFVGERPPGWSQAEPFLYDLIRQGQLTISRQPINQGVDHLICVVDLTRAALPEMPKRAAGQRLTIICTGDAISPLSSELASQALLLKLPITGDSLPLALLILILTQGEISNWPLSQGLHTCILEINREALGSLLSAYAHSLESTSLSLREGPTKIKVHLTPLPSGFDLSEWLNGRELRQPSLPKVYRPSLFAHDADLYRWETHLGETTTAVESHSTHLDKLFDEVLRNRRLFMRSKAPLELHLDPRELIKHRAEVDAALAKARQACKDESETAYSLAPYHQRVPTISSAVRLHLLSRCELLNIVLGIGLPPGLLYLSHSLLTTGSAGGRIWSMVFGVVAAITLFITLGEVLSLWKNHAQLNHQVSLLRGTAREALTQAEEHFYSRLDHLSQDERVGLLRKNRDELDARLAEAVNTAERANLHRTWLREHIAAATALGQVHCGATPPPRLPEVELPKLCLEQGPRSNIIYSPLAYSDMRTEPFTICHDGAQLSVAIPGFNLLRRVTLILDEVFSPCVDS